MGAVICSTAQDRGLGEAMAPPSPLHVFSRNQGDCKHLDVGVVGQRDAAHGFRIVQSEGVAIQQESPAIFSAAAAIAVSHGHSGGFTRKALWGEPVAETLGKRRAAAVREMDNKALRCLVAIYARRQ